MPTGEPFRVTAIIAAYNEADVIAQVVGDFIHQGVQVYLIDHGSTDGTAESVSHFLGRGLLRVERFPEESGFPVEDAGRFAWESILHRKELLARELESEWFIHSDADEFRESPWPGRSLHDAIRAVDHLGFNAVDFALLNFLPTHDDFRAGDDVRAAFPYYEPGAEFEKLQIKAWKNTGAPVDLVSEGGHDVQFPDRSVFPIRFLLRHYPIRSQAHGERKILRDRRPRVIPFERTHYEWHVQYDHYHPGQSLLHDPATLIKFDPEAARLELLL